MESGLEGDKSVNSCLAISRNGESVLIWGGSYICSLRGIKLEEEEVKAMTQLAGTKDFLTPAHLLKLLPGTT